MAEAMASRLGTGRVPGWPRQTGQTFVLGGAPNALGHPQNILVAVESSTWHSRPMTVSNLFMRGPTIAAPEGGARPPPAPILSRSCPAPEPPMMSDPQPPPTGPDLPPPPPG